MLIGTVSELGVPSEKVAKFFKDNWVRPVMLSDQKFYDWQFKQSPKNNGSDCCIIAYDELNDAIAGVMGLNRRGFYLHGVELNGAELTTWIVNENYRSYGAGAKIIKKLMESYDVLIGMGISDAALPIYLRSGFRYLRQIPRFVKIVNYDRVKDFCGVGPIAERLIGNWGQVNIGEHRAEELSGERLKSAFEKVKANLNMFSRLPDDVSWRYESHPYFEYKLFNVFGSEAEGECGAVVAFRIHQVKEGFSILHLMDVFGDARGVAAARSFVERYASENNIDVIDFYCTSSSVYRHFLANHWFSTSDDTYFKFPHLFSPVELRDPPTTSLIYWAKDHLEDIADVSKLYVTKQDADLDRPTPYDFLL